MPHSRPCSTLCAITSFLVLSACITGNPGAPAAPGTALTSNESPAVTSPERYSRFYCQNDQTQFSSGINAAPPLDELSAAAARGDAALLKDIIASGVSVKDSDDICYFDPGGFICRPTPLTLAVRAGSIEAVRLLLNAGAKVDAGIPVARHKLADSPIGQLCTFRIGTPLSSATGDYVVQAGPRYLQGGGLRWPLHRRFQLQARLVEVLLLAGADPNALNHKNDSLSHLGSALIEPLSDVARLGNVEAVNLLLDYGADVNFNSGAMTPLRWAIHWSRVDVMDVLLRRGADPNIEDSVGITDLQYAYQRNDRSVLQKLEEFCAGSKIC